MLVLRDIYWLSCYEHEAGVEYNKNARGLYCVLCTLMLDVMTCHVMTFVESTNGKLGQFTKGDMLHMANFCHDICGKHKWEIGSVYKRGHAAHG